MSSPAAPRQIGTIEAVQGPVVDIVCDHPPPLHRALYAQPNGEPCLLEVFRELGERHVPRSPCTALPDWHAAWR